MVSLLPVHAQTSNENYVTAYFAPELTPGSNFTWRVNEWEEMDDFLNPESNYIPKPGDLWTLNIKSHLPSLHVPVGSTWNILGWHIEGFEFPTLDSKDNSDLLVEIRVANYSFFHAFGNESDNSYNWKMLLFYFLLPSTVEDDSGGKEDFGHFMPATFDNFEIEVTVDVEQGELQLQGSIGGQYEDTEISLNSHLGVREEFVYKKKPIGSPVFSSVLNISLIESVFVPPEPKIPGYSHIITIGAFFMGVITIIVRKKINKSLMKKIH